MKNILYCIFGFVFLSVQLFSMEKSQDGGVLVLSMKAGESKPGPRELVRTRSCEVTSLKLKEYDDNLPVALSLSQKKGSPRIAPPSPLASPKMRDRSVSLSESSKKES